MKARWVVVPAIASLVIFSGLALTTKAFTTEAPATQALSTEAHFAQAQVTEAQAAEALADQSGCLECHLEKKIGPRYHDVAAKYKNDPGARDALIQVVKKGGKGNWVKVTGGSPMPSFSRRLSDAEIRRLVNWVLSQ